MAVSPGKCREHLQTSPRSLTSVILTTAKRPSPACELPVRHPCPRSRRGQAQQVQVPHTMLSGCANRLDTQHAKADSMKASDNFTTPKRPTSLLSGYMLQKQRHNMTPRLQRVCRRGSFAFGGCAAALRRCRLWAGRQCCLALRGHDAGNRPQALEDNLIGKPITPNYAPITRMIVKNTGFLKVLLIPNYAPITRMFFCVLSQIKLQGCIRVSQHHVNTGDIHTKPAPQQALICQIACKDRVDRADHTYNAEATPTSSVRRQVHRQI